VSVGIYKPLSMSVVLTRFLSRSSI